jgi:hypothetical protein
MEWMADLTTVTVTATLTNHLKLVTLPFAVRQHSKNGVQVNRERCGLVAGGVGCGIT